MIKSLLATASSAEVVDVLNRDGCVVVKSLADLKTCDQLEKELAPFLAAKKDEPPKTRPMLRGLSTCKDEAHRWRYRQVARLPHPGRTSDDHGRVRRDAFAELRELPDLHDGGLDRSCPAWCRREPLGISHASAQALRAFSAGYGRRKTSISQSHPRSPAASRKISRSLWAINLTAASASPESWVRIRSKCSTLSEPLSC